MKSILNKCLESLCAFIKKDDVVLDVGCDHALLGIYLTLNKNIKVIGSDINSGPLEKAKDNLIKYHLENKIELRLGDGLETISDDINTIVISGMGGLSIINILKDIIKYPNVSKLVLSPNNDFTLTRKKICDLGFKIVREKIVLEQGKYYLISEFIKGHEDIDYYFGKLDLNDEIVKKYYQYIYDKNLKIINEIGNKSNKKINIIRKENCYIRENIK